MPDVGQGRSLGLRVFAAFLPNGDHFFYVRGRPSDPAPGGVYLATLEEPTGCRVLDDVSAVLFAPKPQHGGHAHLLFFATAR